MQDAGVVERAVSRGAAAARLCARPSVKTQPRTDGRVNERPGRRQRGMPFFGCHLTTNFQGLVDARNPLELTGLLACSRC